jgi:hypothetical protein
MEKFYSITRTDGVEIEVNMIIDLDEKTLEYRWGEKGTPTYSDFYSSESKIGIAEVANEKHNTLMLTGFKLLWTLEDLRGDYASDVDDMVAAEGGVPLRNLIH